MSAYVRACRRRGGAMAAFVVATAAGTGIPACAPAIGAVQEQTGGIMVATADGNRSLIFVAPVDGGVVVVDLGWMNAATELFRALHSARATPEDVVAVLLTHGHRDHIAAWPLVAGAPFYMAAAEADLFLGRAAPEGTLVELGDRLRAPPRPDPGELEIRTFSADTALAFGTDTIRAFAVPGHTPGSSAYLFRGVLFIGDAATGRPFGGLAAAVPVYSADPELAVESLRRLWARLTPYTVRWVCTAHARCVPFEEARAQLGGSQQ